jgi:hypothetical protein
MNAGAVTTETKTIWGLIAVKMVEFKTWIKNNAAMLIGVGITLSYVAAIALLVIGVVRLIEAWGEAGKANEKALEEANKRVKEFSE